MCVVNSMDSIFTELNEKTKKVTLLKEVKVCVHRCMVQIQCQLGN